MKYILLLSLLVFVFACSSDVEQDESKLARIKAKIEHIPSGTSLVKLKRMGLQGPETVDSAEISEGAFSLAVPADSDYLYRLEIGSSFLPVFLEAGEHELKADFQQLYQSAIYSNSPLTAEMRKTETLRLGFEAKAQALQNIFQVALYSGNEKKADSARQAFELLLVDSKKEVKNLINGMGPGPVAYLATSMLSPEEDFSYLDSLALRFEKEKPGKIYTRKIVSYMEIPRRFAIGKKAPDFSLPNPAGTPLALSSFKGKWVLLDFWASWCKPCRAENPVLVEVNRRYKKRGLQIFSVSLDGDREAWMKAIVLDEMNWAHASDLKGWKSSASQLYAINSVPSSFLIDPDGNIAAKNLRGEFLKEKLKAIFP
jgi:peroxiredoxin